MPLQPMLALHFRLRCSYCRAFTRFEIGVMDIRNMGDNSKPCPQDIIVAKGN